ncbi:MULTISPECIES: ATP-binding protein [unclassified Polynucleobacter]|uniref:sensor histidine kinase n=1 Tax=unclassified Polynucleobacter TaxID=2640945 RepID=UPI0025D5A589|nr:MULTISPECIES: ATP-binding protein [unclassified Polynucleobacter]
MPNVDPAKSFQYQVDYCQTQAPSNQIAEAVNCDYQPQYLPLNSGFEESPRWMRIQLSDEFQDIRSIAIQVSPYFLKQIDLFWRSNSGWVNEQAGARTLSDRTHKQIGGHLFVVPLNPKTSNTFYLRIQASSLTHIAVTVSPWTNEGPHNYAHFLGIGVQVGILFAILAFSLVSAALNPTTIMARFSISAANLMLCLISGSGILAIYIFPHEPLLNELIFNWALCMRLALWVWVSAAFLLGKKVPRWYKPSCYAIYLMVGISMLLIGIGKANIANPIMLLAVFVAPILQIIAIYKTPTIGRTLQIVLILGFCLSILLIILAILAVLFPVQNNSQIPIYLSRLTDFVNPLVMLSIIVFQNRLARKELLEVKAALTETQLRSEYETKLLKDRRTLIDMLTHELKNPLASIGLAIDTLSQSIDSNSPHDQRRLKNINRSISNMDAIIERCNLMNLIDQKSLPFSPSEINVREFISNIIENLQCENQAILSIQGNTFIHTDPQFLHIILSNLIENSLKYSSADSKITIRAQTFFINGHSGIRITIANPVPPELAPEPHSLFHRFYRHPLAQKTRGSGLGLYICKELCAVLGGAIQYQYINHDATFTIELPQ